MFNSRASIIFSVLIAGIFCFNTGCQTNGPKEEQNTPGDSMVEYGIIDSLTGTIDEPGNISRFGEGKVSRPSIDELQIALPNGKSVSFKNVGEDTDEGQATYQFMGSVSTLNSYLVYCAALEADGYYLVNKLSGSKVFIPNLDFKISPDKKWLAVSNNDIISALENSFIEIFSIMPQELKSVYSKQTYDVQNNEGWGAASIKWLSPSSLQISKVTGDSESEEIQPAGECYIVLNNQEWTLSESLKEN